ncbi:MAG: type II secretion system protein N [Burkholderiales bacterium]
MGKNQYCSDIMATLRFHQSVELLPHLTRWLALLLLAGLLGLWSMRLFAPTPLPVPVSPLPNSTEPGSAAWRGLFAGAGAGSGAVLLRGVIVASPQESVAVLSVNGGPARAHKIGSEIAPGIRLTDVNAQSVTLERNGVRETLTLSPRPATKIAPTSSH